MKKEKKVIVSWIAAGVLVVLSLLLLFGGQPWLAVAPGILAIRMPYRRRAAKTTPIPSGNSKSASR